MKIEVIKEENNVFDVRFTPSWLGRVFGRRKRVEKFKFRADNEFIHYPGRGAYENQYGEIQHPLKEWVKELDRHRRKW